MTLYLYIHALMYVLACTCILYTVHMFDQSMYVCMYAESPREQPVLHVKASASKPETPTGSAPADSSPDLPGCHGKP